MVRTATLMSWWMSRAISSDSRAKGSEVLGDFWPLVRVGVWEAVYLIQGLLDEQSKVKPSQVHTDTQGQVLPVYALAHLFGFDLTQIRGQILMTEPERDNGDVVARVEKSHRDVWSDGLPGEPRTGLRRGADVLGEAVLDRIRNSRRREAGIDASIGTVGVAHDNSLAESINGLYKTELIKPRRRWRNADHVEAETATYLDWFNNRRLYEYCGDMPPVKLEQIFYDALSISEVAQFL